MDLDTNRLQPASTLLRHGNQDAAPDAVFAAMVTLADPAEVRASLCAYKEGDGRTEWRAVWLTDTNVIACTASAPTTGWKYGTHRAGEIDVEIEAAATKVADIVSVSVTNAEIWREFDGPSAAVGATVTTRDGKSFTVPPFGGTPGNGELANTEKFLAELVARF